MTRRAPRNAEKTWIPVNGIKQGMFITGIGAGKPVLLFVHGGPGMPEHWLTRRYPTGLERLFTVCWWEQRGAGLSYRPDIPASTMTLEQFVADTLAVTDYLRGRFATDRIYLMAHSWGSYVGIQAAVREPSRFEAYIGVSQITHQVASEQLSWRYMLDEYRARGDAGMVRRLERAPVTTSVPLPAGYDALRDKAMHGLGVGTTRDTRSVVTDIFLRSLLSPDYTLREKLGLWRGKMASRRTGLWDAMQATDLTRVVTDLEIPAYFFHGRHDYTVSYPLAKRYAGQLRAPLVGFYTFANSAHSPVLEEPERARKILLEDVLARSTSLSDEYPTAPRTASAGG